MTTALVKCFVTQQSSVVGRQSNATQSSSETHKAKFTDPPVHLPTYQGNERHTATSSRLFCITHQHRIVLCYTAITDLQSSSSAPGIRHRLCLFQPHSLCPSCFSASWISFLPLTINLHVLLLLFRFLFKRDTNFSIGTLFYSFLHYWKYIQFITDTTVQ